MHSNFKASPSFEKNYFFKAQEVFKDDDFDEMDEGKLLKTLRVTKNMLFLWEQLPNENYGTLNIIKNCDKNKKTNNNATINANNTNKSTKDDSSLPNITTNSHYPNFNEEKKLINSEYSNKIINKYKLNTNNFEMKIIIKQIIY